MLAGTGVNWFFRKQTVAIVSASCWMGAGVEQRESFTSLIFFIDLFLILALSHKFLSLSGQKKKT